MKKLNTLGKVITKIFEVFHWVGVALMLAAIICSVAAPKLVGYFIGFDTKECCGANLEVYGFEVNAPVVDGKIDTATFVIFGIGSVIILALMAMVFRNLNKIFKKSENTTYFFHCFFLQIKNVFWLNIEYYSTKIYVCQYVFNVCR